MFKALRTARAYALWVLGPALIFTLGHHWIFQTEGPNLWVFLFSGFLAILLLRDQLDQSTK